MENVAPEIWVILMTSITEIPKMNVSATDFLLTSSIRRKRMSCEVTRKPVLAKTHQMLEQFFLFGASPDINTPPSPTLLAMYPSTSNERSRDEIDHIMSFCFPDGFEESHEDRSVLKQFVFYLTGNDERLYGVCVQIKRPLGMTSNVTRDFPFCLCMISACPFISSHIQFLTFLGQMLCGKICDKRDQCVASRPPLPVRGFCLPGMILDKTFPVFAVRKKVRIPRFLFEEIVFYQNLSTGYFSEGQWIQLEGGFAMDIPYHLTDSKRLLYPSLQFLFSSLSLEDIADVYCGILLEQQVLFVSESVEKASMCVIAATALIAPFEITAYVMPVVPTDEKFSQLFDSPIPFVFGSTSRAGSADIVVDVDKGVVSRSSAIPQLPRKKELVKNLRSIIQSHADVITVPEHYQTSWLKTTVNPAYYNFLKAADPYTFPASFACGVATHYIFNSSIVELIIQCFTNSIAPELKETAQACFVTDTTIPEHPVTVVNNSLFLSQYKANDRDFWSAFLSTQIATDFCGRLADHHSSSLSDSDSPHLRSSRRYSN